MADVKREETSMDAGRLVRVSGPMIAAEGLAGVAMGDLLHAGRDRLLAEVIRIDGDIAYAQVFEETQGMRLGELVEPAGEPLSVELGPGLLGGTFDGIQRPLAALRELSGDSIGRGLQTKALDRVRRWRFVPSITVGDEIGPGEVLGTLAETEAIEHRVLAPPWVRGVVGKVVPEGEYAVNHAIVTLEDGARLTMCHRWPVKTPRPAARKLPPDTPFMTGRRVLDCLFPVALGGSAILPGGFGTGKTVVEQSLAKFAAADVVIYVGCGERGNEMADVLSEFPELDDPKTGQSLMNRTVLVVNTSNMPVAARDASIYTGVTIAEYYRDQGYDVALMADSTSRWAEALREVSSRLEEMPGEEGYPTYLAARIAAFYERSGRAVCLGSDERQGSVTLVGAVSPPGGDFSEPVTQTSQRVAGALWALDSALAYRRHYPAINWNRSYSLYCEQLAPWFARHAPEGWERLRSWVTSILQRDGELQEVVQLVGPDALQDSERLVLETARMVREVFLQQSAFSETDAYSPLDKTAGLAEALLSFHEEAKQCLARGVALSRILDLPVREDLARLREEAVDTFAGRKEEVMTQMTEALAGLEGR